jgi:hypothetical protein
MTVSPVLPQVLCSLRPYFTKGPVFLSSFPSAFCRVFPQKDCRPAALCGILGADGFVFPKHSLKIHSFFQFLL